MRSAKPLLVALVLGACATAQPIPEPTIATIGAKGAVVDTIDARNVRDETAGARFEIPPGPHTVEVSLAKEPAADASADADVKVIAVCFDAVAGHSYLTRPVFEEQRWRPEIVDEETGAIVLAGCRQPVDPDAPPASIPAAVVSTPVTLPVPAAPPGPKVKLPGTGLDVALGFCFGGDSLYDVTFSNAPDRSLSAGRGVLVALGGKWTPLWIEDSVGFGLGASVGWKYDSISAVNGSVSLSRFPITATVHSLFRISDRWFAIVGGGLQREVGGRVSGDGFGAKANSDLDSGWGLIGSGTLYYRLDRASLGGGLQYSALHDEFQGAKVDASSFGIIGSGQYSF